MTADATVNESLAELVQTHGSCTAPLDAAIEYLRVRGARIFPLYVLAMAPHAIAVKWLLRYVQSHRFTLFAWYRIVLGVVLMGLVMAGFFSTQARATWVLETPRALAPFSTSATTAWSGSR